MIVFCFICKNGFRIIEKLFIHLKYYHSLSPNSVHECGYPFCKQSFTTFRSFSRHMKSERATLKEDVNDTQQNSIPSTSQGVVSTLSLSKKNSLDLEGIYFNVNTNKEIRFDRSLMKKSTLEFSFKYFGKKNLCRKDALNIQDDVKIMITNKIGEQIHNVIEHVKEDKIREVLENIIEFCKNPFEEIDSEYKFLRELCSLDLYEKYTVIHIDSSIQPIVSNGHIKIAEKVTSGIIFPLKFQFRKFFEINDVLDSFLENANTIKIAPGITNFINGHLWHTKIKNMESKTVIPYFLYFDDFEVNNPLGSHCSSVLGVYYSFPTSPLSLKHKLKNIFLAALFKTKDVKYFGNNRCFSSLIEIINDLEINGIDINTGNGLVRVHFVMSLILGDNLALNNTLGFSGSFSSSFYCRFCKSNKKLCQSLAEEDSNYLRTKSNYDSDIQTSEYSLTGLKENSIFNKIHSFHVTENFAVDILHDLFEGIMVYDMCHIIQYFIHHKVFDIDTLNNRKSSFHYGESEIGNLSQPISVHNLKTFNLKLSAREMLTFVHFFPLIMGDLVPRGNSCWNFLINLIEMMDIILLSSFNSVILAKLKKCIIYHNTKYVELFSDTLKPKHHFLVHYCKVIENSGPLKYLWTFSFESKHRDLKMYAKNITSRKNILVSMATKFAINFSNNIYNFENIKFVITCKGNPVAESQYFGLFKNIYEGNLNEAFCYESIEFLGTMYKRSYIVFCSNIKFSAYKIKEILLINKKIYLFCQEIEIIKYDRHLSSYCVGEDIQFFIFKGIEFFENPPVHIYLLPSGDKVIRIKNAF